MPHEDDVRRQRQAAIREIVGAEAVSTQAEVARRLSERGFEVTQSSVSRDLAELGVEKRGGRYVLAPSGALPGLVGVRTAGPYLVVLKTVVGAAPLLGVEIDQRGWDEVVGTVAGDDTIFLAVATPEDQARVVARLAGVA